MEMDPDKIELENLSKSFEYFKVSSEFTGFSLNPILIRRSFLLEILEGASDDSDDATPLRSGENVLDRRWRSNPKNFSASLDGPFRHIGFHNNHNYIWPMPRYILKFIFRVFQ
jgi:hypothetical protein